MNILSELISREPIFHRREFGTSRKALENMTDESFWEIGASGRSYSRQTVIGLLLKRYAEGPEPHDFPCEDFSLTFLSENLYLLSYTLLEPSRPTKRTTIWRLTNEGWKIVFHQGTLTV